MTEQVWTARSVVKGIAKGKALVSGTALSFLGDLDIRSGRVVGQSSDLCGETVSGQVLVLPETRGSAGAWRFLYQLKVHGTHPAALVLRDMPDPSVTQGAFLAEVPILVAPEDGFWTAVQSGDVLQIDAVAGRIMRV